MNQIVITKEPICIVRLMEELSQHDCCGALVWFAGIVRNENDGKPVNQIYYECYEPMAKKELEKIVEESTNAFLSLQSSTVAALNTNLLQAEYDLNAALVSFGAAENLIEKGEDNMTNTRYGMACLIGTL